LPSINKRKHSKNIKEGLVMDELAAGGLPTMKPEDYQYCSVDQEGRGGDHS
jgi:hypothetical protein